MPRTNQPLVLRDARHMHYGRAYRRVGLLQPHRTDATSLGTTGVRWAWDLTFGGVTRRAQPKSLLDTTPLRPLLRAQIPFAQIERNLAAGHLRALALIATDLHTANGVVFVQSNGEVAAWRRRRWRVERTAIGVEHLMASSAGPPPPSPRSRACCSTRSCSTRSRSTSSTATASTRAC